MSQASGARQPRDQVVLCDLQQPGEKSADGQGHAYNYRSGQQPSAGEDAGYDSRPPRGQIQDESNYVIREPQAPAYDRGRGGEGSAGNQGPRREPAGQPDETFPGDDRNRRQAGGRTDAQSLEREEPARNPARGRSSRPRGGNTRKGDYFVSKVAGPEGEAPAEEGKTGELRLHAGGRNGQRKPRGQGRNNRRRSDNEDTSYRRKNSRYLRVTQVQRRRSGRQARKPLLRAPGPAGAPGRPSPPRSARRSPASRGRPEDRLRRSPQAVQAQARQATQTRRQGHRQSPQQRRRASPQSRLELAAEPRPRHPHAQLRLPLRRRRPRTQTERAQKQQSRRLAPRHRHRHPCRHLLQSRHPEP